MISKSRTPDDDQIRTTELDKKEKLKFFCFWNQNEIYKIYDLI